MSGLAQLPGRPALGQMRHTAQILLLLHVGVVFCMSEKFLPSPFSPGVASFITTLKENTNSSTDGVVLLDYAQTVVHNARNFSWRASKSPPNSPWCSYIIADDPSFAQFEFVNNSLIPMEITWVCDTTDDTCDHLSLGCTNDESKYIFFIAVPLIMLLWAIIFKLCDAWPSLSRKWRKRNFVPASYFEMSSLEESTCEITEVRLEEEPEA